MTLRKVLKNKMKITLLKYKVGNLDLEKLHHQDKKLTETFGGEESVHFQ